VSNQGEVKGDDGVSAPPYHESMEEKNPASMTAHDIDELRLSVDKTATQIKQIRDNAEEYMVNATKMSQAGVLVTEAMHEYYADSKEGNTSELSQCSSKAHAQMRQSYIPQMRKEMLEGVVVPLNAWLGEYERMNSKLTQSLAAQKRMNHYITKLDGLKRDKLEKEQSGKLISAQALERLTRNEGKLNVAKKEFDSLHEGVGQALLQLDQSRHDLIGNSMTHFIEAEEKLLQTMHKNAETIVSWSSHQEGRSDQPMDEKVFNYVPLEDPVIPVEKKSGIEALISGFDWKHPIQSLQN